MVVFTNECDLCNFYVRLDLVHVSFLLCNSSELKAQVSFSDCLLSVIFASQGFRSWSPLSSPLADWAGFCNSCGSPSSSFHKPSLQRWHHFDQWMLLTVSCLRRCKMAAPSVHIFDCIHVMFLWSIVSDDLIEHS